jgi:transcriptional regulator with XRE-family HTH domain
MKNTLSELSEYQVVTTNLKRKLKDQKLSYKDLATELGLSESGIKKILSGSDGSFQRIIQICQVIGVSVYELLQDSKKLDVSFDKNQQDEFLRDLALFKVYWMLVYERKAALDVQQKLKLTKSEFFKKLRKLDSLRLLKLLPNERLQLPSIKAVRWIGEGDFLNKIYREWSQNLLDSVAKPNANGDEFFLLRYLPMSQKNYKDFQQALLSLEEEYIRRSIQDMRTKGSETQHVRWMIVADSRSFV